ncbi:hypothetical protein DEO72_LG2g2708 [Vigna unguiculata]|uniref:Uncharacterized protein n=1 Tax=Vigna unguiculata TaxID=3917 RepID=A0A4D6L1K2_VIGUN|nr:hypothetical protein DEO72_LG2g2708 [Vigna unguiculata]
MSSSSDRVSLSDSGSEPSRDSGSSREDTSDREEMGSIGRIPMERVVEVREDPPEELAESNWPAKTEYEWVTADVRTQRSLFWRSRLLRSWLNCTPIFEKGAQRDIVAPERVTVVEWGFDFAKSFGMVRSGHFSCWLMSSLFVHCPRLVAPLTTFVMSLGWFRFMPA